MTPDAWQVLDEAFIQADKAAARRNERWQRQQERQIEERARDLAAEDFDNAAGDSMAWINDLLMGAECMSLDKHLLALLRAAMRCGRHGQDDVITAANALRAHYVDLNWERFVDRAREDLNV